MKIMQVVGCVVHRKEKFLILKRNKNIRQPLQWGIPSGRIDEGEDVVSAVKREVYEETGLFIKDTDLIFKYTALLDFSKDGYMVNYHVYEYFSPENFVPILNPDEHLEYRWVTPEECLNTPNLITGLDEVINKVFKHS